MVKVKEDMTGWVMSEHGVPDSRLTVLYQTEDHISSGGQHFARWMCQCSCNEKNIFPVRQEYLRSGHTKSCGCLVDDTVARPRPDRRKLNTYDLSGEYGIGWTHNTNREFYFDLEDYDKIKNYCWREDISPNGYSMLKTRVEDKQVLMHNLLGFINYDHKNRNSLDNRKSNLRQCTVVENCRNRSKRSDNTSGVIGVTWHKPLQKWRATINLNKKLTHIGYYTNKNDAIVARLKAEFEHYGEFAPQKNLFQEYGIIKEDLDDVC